MKGLRIDYTIYSPDHTPGGQGECWDHPTVRGARKKAKELGIGSLVVRNFNLGNKRGSSDWWQTPYCWVWDGFAFKKVYPADEQKWKVDRLAWSQAPVLRHFRTGKC